MSDVLIDKLKADFEVLLTAESVPFSVGLADKLTGVVVRAVGATQEKLWNDLTFCRTELGLARSERDALKETVYELLCKLAAKEDSNGDD